MMGGYGLEKGKEEETGMTSATVAWKKGRMGRRGFPFSPSTRLHPGDASTLLGEEGRKPVVVWKERENSRSDEGSGGRNR
ncbi:hypothetical protein PRIPAC_89096 [Pristionchus pacificus]|uniref:Uncharacterized protein n=1 Tax=Pristionchus pacificus TaxID=54126 RepID=A0A2A6CYX7_PRIPA|nr:hypothetical protein PRIPAC_89096 [Pristionchus pacificus]|eukprot:PDM83369.1 hypothetical protein PRIPAC_35001 [Pristionchus pacificus]